MKARPNMWTPNVIYTLLSERVVKITSIILGVTCAAILASGCESSGVVPAPSAKFVEVASAQSDPVSELPNEDPTPSPTVSVTPSPSETPTASPSPSPSPSISPSASPSPYVYKGSGTISDPFIIESAEDVQNIDSHPSAYFTITQDISFENFGNFRPLAAFSGVIYGNNHQFYRMTIATTGAETATMFTSLSGTLVQIGVVQANVSSQSGYASALVGNLTASGVISSCLVEGSVTSPLGGTGYYSGTGNGLYVTRNAGSHIYGSHDDTLFNGNHQYNRLYNN